MYPICKIYVSDNKMNVTMYESNATYSVCRLDGLHNLFFGANQYVTYKTGVGIGQHIYDLIKQ